MLTMDAIDAAGGQPAAEQFGLEEVEDDGPTAKAWNLAASAMPVTATVPQADQRFPNELGSVFIALVGGANREHDIFVDNGATEHAADSFAADQEVSHFAHDLGPMSPRQQT